MAADKVEKSAHRETSQREENQFHKNFQSATRHTATPATLLEFVKVDAPERKSDFTQSIVAALRRRDSGNQPFNNDVICQIRKYY